MYRNMVTSLLEHGRIKTTELKAKELRRYAEKTISKSLRVGDLLERPVDERTPAEQSRVVHAMRMAGRMVRSREVLQKLFEEIAPRMKGRPGGYTRIVKVGRRVGDAAPMAIIELV
jgi:large subunit ribosomal protein L17